jgi:hypothetical protein
MYEWKAGHWPHRQTWTGNIHHPRGYHQIDMVRFQCPGQRAHPVMTEMFGRRDCHGVCTAELQGAQHVPFVTEHRDLASTDHNALPTLDATAGCADTDNAVSVGGAARKGLSEASNRSLAAHHQHGRLELALRPLARDDTSPAPPADDKRRQSDWKGDAEVQARQVNSEQEGYDRD